MPSENFAPLGPVGAPTLFYKLRSRITSLFTNDRHWSDQIVDALAEGYSTPEEINKMLLKDPQEFTLRETLLAFHWFFKGVSVCDGEHTLEYRLRNLRHADRVKSK